MIVPPQAGASPVADIASQCAAEKWNLAKPERISRRRIPPKNRDSVQTNSPQAHVLEISLIQDGLPGAPWKGHSHRYHADAQQKTHTFFLFHRSAQLPRE